MVWHLHIGLKLRSLEPPEVLSRIWTDLVKKLKPPERPLLEVRRFFQWCQGMSLGILKRFWEKKVNLFFWLCSLCPRFQRPHLLISILYFSKLKNIISWARNWFYLILVLPDKPFKWYTMPNTWLEIIWWKSENAKMTQNGLSSP